MTPQPPPPPSPRGPLAALSLALVHELRLFWLAMQFLTRVPVPAWVGWQPEWMPASMRHFPLVGALVGLFGATVLALASAWWPPAVAVGLSMAATVWLTGGFHEDGWADTCDGLGGAVSREKALLIMKDSRLGTYGALGLILLLGLKATVLVELLTSRVHELDSARTSRIHHVLLLWTSMGLVWAHVLSRLVPVLLTRLLPYAGDVEHAKAKPLALAVATPLVWATAANTGVVAAAMGLFFLLDGWPMRTLWQALAWGLLGAALVLVFCLAWLKRRLGGFTGDTLGASQQLAELAILLAWLQVVHPVAG